MERQSTAQQSESEQIPVIDFGAFLGGDRTARHAVAAAISAACREIGFLYLVNHGMTEDLLAGTFAAAQDFFARPEEEKRRLAWSEAVSNRGYVALERERLDPALPGDLKEAFNVGAEGMGVGKGAGALVQNHWPDDPPTFRATVMTFFEACCHQADRVLEAFALALDLPESFFVAAHDQRDHTLRLLHYPPLPPAFHGKPGQIRAGGHTDYGSITLLYQDAVGGLEVRNRQGIWLAAPPIPGTVLINTGDLMARWTNEVFCSTHHRVGLPRPDQVGRSRHSIAFFCHPNHDAEIRCLPSCTDAARPPLYPPITAGEHLLSKLYATY